MKPVVVLGAGEHAVVVIDILRAMGGFDVVGCLADNTDPEQTVYGVPVIGGMDRIPTLAAEGYAAAIGCGGWVDNDPRARVYNLAVAAGVEIVTAIHPRAYIAPDCTIGQGSVICAGAHIGVCTTVGRNTIVHCEALVGHLCLIGDHVLISGGATIGAAVTVADGATVAIGATVASRVSIGEQALVSAGSTADRDVAPGARVRGVPARPRGRIRGAER